MADLIEKLRRARERRVEVGGFDFTVRRPTDIEALELRRGCGLGDLLRFVVGWGKVKELDIVPGGGPEPVPFDAALAAEWLADRPDLLQPLADEVLDGYRDHVAALEKIAKN